MSADPAGGRPSTLRSGESDATRKLGQMLESRIGHHGERSMVMGGIGIMFGVFTVILSAFCVWFVRAELFGQGITMSYLKYRLKRDPLGDPCHTRDHGRDRASRL